jgi:hypothetical protein
MTDTASSERRDGGTTEYAANAEAGDSEDTGYVQGAEEDASDVGQAADLDPHEPPGQG